MKTIIVIVLIAAAALTTPDTEAGTAIYYMPFFTTDTANPTYCWIANKSTGSATASIQIMTNNSSTAPTQIPLTTTLSLPAKRSKMVTFYSTTIIADSTILDISSEVGSSGVPVVYSADITFSSTGTLNCTMLGMSCFQGTTTPRRNLVGYTCYDGTYFTY
ncbi:MAG: hypothetical protein H7843_04990 [Nitrospirota bacterium]